MKTKSFLLGFLLGILLFISTITIAEEPYEDLSSLSDECLGLLLDCESRTLEEQTAHQETINNLDICNHSWGGCQERESKYIKTINELEILNQSKDLRIQELQNNPIEQFGLTYSFDLSYGTSLLFEMTPRLYLYKGLNLFLNAGLSYGQYGDYSKIPDFMGTVGLGYTIF